MSKSIIVTGASRGIGLAITNHLLNQGHTLVLVARSRQVLDDLKAKHGAQVEIVAGDLGDFALAQTAVDAAVEKAGRLDGLVVNHGILGDVSRVADSDAARWRETFDVNFFGVVALVQAALPHLRMSHGRIIFTSSGAALHAYASWGAYGASKAALNHLAMTLGNEEPDVTTVSIRPGVVDSEMQREIREVHSGRMDAEDTKKFRKAKEEGTLLRPEQPGNVIAKLVVGAGKDLSGKFVGWNDPVLKEFQDEES